MSSTASYVHGASAKQLIGQTIGRFFDEACARHAEREALVVRHQNVRLTYAQTNTSKKTSSFMFIAEKPHLNCKQYLLRANCTGIMSPFCIK